LCAHSFFASFLCFWFLQQRRRPTSKQQVLAADKCDQKECAIVSLFQLFVTGSFSSLYNSHRFIIFCCKVLNKSSWLCFFKYSTQFTTFDWLLLHPLIWILQQQRWTVK
jgi:hypothetical protein